VTADHASSHTHCKHLHDHTYTPAHTHTLTNTNTHTHARTRSKRAYSGLPREAVIERVYKSGMRPRFPPTAPPAFVALAEECWHSDPSRRPPFNEIAERLDLIATELLSPAAAAARAAAGAARSAGGGAAEGNVGG
jgi:hypothetical protein